MMIYKIFRADEWAAFEAAGETLGAPIDLADGYIHISTGAQVAETVSKYFGGIEGLQILALDPDTLGDKLKWEPSRGGALFPHLYRMLRMDDIAWVKPLPLDGDEHVFPEGML
ncbi:hypothetical protein A9Q96_07940 [Rhodobacterales bacterium 52_120_T64]|nr:hypothetical protein A9Q96_07940 [Rhodobacterales bacterium 52_120_T64]